MLRFETRAGIESVLQGHGHLVAGEDAGVDNVIDAEIRFVLPKVQANANEICAMSE